MERQARSEEILFEQDVVADPATKREPRGVVAWVLDHLDRQIGVVGEEVDRRAAEHGSGSAGQLSPTTVLLRLASHPLGRRRDGVRSGKGSSARTDSRSAARADNVDCEGFAARNQHYLQLRRPAA